MKFKKIFTMLSLAALASTASAQKFNMLVGVSAGRANPATNTPAAPSGILVYEFDAATGKATLKKPTFPLGNPSYLTLSANEKFVYTVSENTGGLNALTYDSKTGDFKLLNTVKSGSGGPTYISTDPAGKYIFGANYGGGSMTAVPIEADGSLGSDVQDFKHVGGSKLMKKAYTHSAVVSPDGKFVVTSDLGTDSLNVYSINPKARPNGIKSVSSVYLTEGAGPRHSFWSANGKFLYSVTEKNSTVNVLSFDSKAGKLTLLQSESMLPPGYKDAKGGTLGDGADIKLSADGKFLYATTRNILNAMAIYSVDQKTGKITAVGSAPLQAVSSRTFTIDPTGKWIVVTSQGTKELIFFKRDPKTGLITPTGDKIALDGSPGIAKFSKI